MLYLVAGARPNFVKLAPLVHALVAHGGLPFQIVHTGQHYDDAMSGSFFRVLDIPKPDVNLEVGSGSHGAQTARVLERFEQLLLDRRPTAVVVFGDVTSTAACSLAASKLQVPVVHVEAGLRSFDRTMPEEINRIVTDALSDLLFVSEPAGLLNLGHEGTPQSKVRYVGNIMIDSLRRVLPEAHKRGAHDRLGLATKGYALLTMHRPSNVDRPETLAALMGAFDRVSRRIPIVFPVHPRTRARLAEAGVDIAKLTGVRLIDPVDYVDSLGLQAAAKVVFTDSGGMQEESSCVGVPCITLRENTERPVTVERGTSTLVGSDPAKIEAAFENVLAGTYKAGGEIPLWDGQTAPRIVADLAAAFS